jgi:hypothetical protein
MKSWHRRVALVAGCLVACAGGVGVASALTDSRPTGDPGEPALAGSERIGARSSDPDSGPGWAVRSHETQAGRHCLEAGRFDGDSFGRAQADGTIAEIPPAGHGTCREAEDETDQAAIVRYATSGREGARTVAFGKAAISGSQVTVASAATDVADDGTFVVVYRGLVEPTELPVEVVRPDGTRMRFDWR